MSGLVRYGSYTVEQVQKDKEEAEKSGGSADFWKVPQGKSTVRFLPPRVGTTELFRTRYQHWLDVPGMEKRVNFICPRMQAKVNKVPPRYCPACARVDQLREDGSPAALDMAKEMQPSRRIIANIVSRTDPERGVLIWEFGKQVHDQLLAIADDQDSGGDFSNPIQGFDIVVERKGKGQQDTNYKLLPARNITKLATDVETMNAWLESMHDLDALIRIPSDEEIRRITGGGSRDRGAAPARDAAPARNAPRRRTAADDADDSDAIDTTAQEVDE